MKISDAQLTGWNFNGPFGSKNVLGMRKRGKGSEIQLFDLLSKIWRWMKKDRNCLKAFAFSNFLFSK